MHICVPSYVPVCPYKYICVCAMHACVGVWYVFAYSQDEMEEVCGLEEPPACQCGPHLPPLFLFTITQAPGKRVRLPCWAEDTAVSVHSRAGSSSCLWHLSMTLIHSPSPRYWFLLLCLWICSLLFCDNAEHSQSFSIHAELSPWESNNFLNGLDPPGQRFRGWGCRWHGDVSSFSHPYVPAFRQIVWRVVT